jgi:hypothetical protein
MKVWEGEGAVGTNELWGGGCCLVIKAKQMVTAMKGMWEEWGWCDLYRFKRPLPAGRHSSLAVGAPDGVAV